MTNKQIAEDIYDRWAEEVGMWNDPVIYPRKEWPAEGWTAWKALMEMIEKALDEK
jgi:hypothetical protein